MMFSEETTVIQQTAPETTRSASPVIYKVTDNGSGGSAEPAAPLTNDEIADGVAQALVDTERDMRAEFETALAPLRERMAAMEARIETLLTLLGADPSRSKSARRRLQQDDTRFLEAPAHRHSA